MKIFFQLQWAVAFVVLAGCGSKDPADSAALPEDSSVPEDTGAPWVPVDTGGDTVLDDVPTDLLTIREWGTWTLSPPAATTYTSLAGELAVQEYLNGAIPDTEDPIVLECDLVYQVNGVPSLQTCTGCDFAFEVTFALLSGDPGGCHDPALPQHEETWTVGYDPTRRSVDRDLGGSGLWFHWFDGELTGDDLAVEWEVVVGVSVEEEEPE